VTASDGTFTNKVEVTWDGVPTANEYQIFRDTDPGGGGMTQIGSKTSHTYSDTAVADLQVYYYWVKACNQSGCSELSTPDSGYAQLYPIYPPATVSASDGSFEDKVELNWDAVGDATEYQIFRDTDPGGGGMTLIGSTTSVSFNDFTVVDLVMYYYWIKACNISDCSPVSTEDSGYAEVAPLFWDDFETGDFSRWTRAKTGNGYLYVCKRAGMEGIYGACVARGTTPYRKQLVDTSPSKETSISTSFKFDINGLSMGTNEPLHVLKFKMFKEVPVYLVVKYDGSQYILRLITKLDDLTKIKTSWIPFRDEPITIEIDWQAASGPAADNGFAEIYINGVLQQALIGLDNDTHFITHYNLGITNQTDGFSFSGKFLIDDVETRNDGYIGVP
jgi:hypothetical protein